jgi:beta-glucosidase
MRLWMQRRHFHMRHAHLNDELSPAERAELLLAEMTLEEKVGQMCQYVGEAAAPRSSGMPASDPPRTAAVPENADEIIGYALGLGEIVELVRSGRVGSFLKVPGARFVDYLQQLASQSRLGIPLLIGTDAIHGHGMDLQASTIFPTPITLAASFDVELAERIAECTAREMRATGFHWSFSPNVDVVRDPRWGRTGETFGEDPLLVGELGAAFVRGYQGEALGKDGVLACAKHLVAGGAPENGLNGAPTEISERTLEEFYYPPFERAVEAGVLTVMPSHNEVGGVPCHADARLLGERLRGAWGFRGFVVSDWLDIERLHSVHRVAETRLAADEMAVQAGIDMHMHGGVFFENVCALVRAGRIPERRIDSAVLPILAAKFALGLFEHAGSLPQQIERHVLCAEHRALALGAARKSLVLLTNDGVLPLVGLTRVLVTGPCADDQSILGDWARIQPDGNVISVLEGIRRAAPPAVRVAHVPTGPISSISSAQIDAAAAAAADADVVIAVVGENSLRDNPERTSGENVDRVSLDLPGAQNALLEALSAAGKPLVVVLVNGAPLASEWLVRKAAAILDAWEPGMCGGVAVGEVLFGAVSPSGKLPMTVPRSAGHIKAFYNQRPSTHHRGKLRFGSSEPLFRFGHGLSYTTFAYRELRVRSDVQRLSETLRQGRAIEVEVTLENTGGRAGEEIVLLYLQDVFASVTRPVQELAAFRRVRLERGELQKVVLAVPARAFSLLDVDLERRIEPGEFRLSVGNGELGLSVWVA